MPQAGAQLFCLPEELIPIFEPFIEKHNLFVIAVRFPPYSAIEFPRHEFSKLIRTKPRYHELFLSLKPPDLPLRGKAQFPGQNPNNLSLLLGGQFLKGLKETWIGTLCEDEGAFAVWKTIINKIRRVTTSGVTPISPVTGQPGKFTRNFRFTREAKRLEQEGVSMISVTGMVMKLGEISQSKKS